MAVDCILGGPIPYPLNIYILCPVTLQFLLLTWGWSIPPPPLNLESSHLTCLGQWIFMVCLLCQ